MPLVTSVDLAMSHALTNLAVPTGSNWTEQVDGIGVDENRRRALRFDQRADWRPSAIQCEAGKVKHQREQHATDHHRLAADPVAEPAEVDVERCANDGHDDQQQVLGLAGQA